MRDRDSLTIVNFKIIIHTFPYKVTVVFLICNRHLRAFSLLNLEQLTMLLNLHITYNKSQLSHIFSLHIRGVLEKHILNNLCSQWIDIHTYRNIHICFFLGPWSAKKLLCAWKKNCLLLSLLCERRHRNTSELLLRWWPYNNGLRQFSLIINCLLLVLSPTIHQKTPQW